MSPPRESVPAPLRARRPQLDVKWAGGWQGFREALRALRTPLPMLPPRAALTAFRAAELRRGWPGRGLLASVALHLLFLVVPLPEFLTRPPTRQTAFSKIRIEYDLRWTGSHILPPLSPAPKPRRRPRPGGQKDKPLPPPGADAVQPQTIVSNPAQPNHPRQTLLNQFALEKARIQVRDLRLPNLVIPPAPLAAPTAELHLRRLRIPGTPLSLQRMPQAPVPPRPKSASELALAQTQLENLFPKLAIAPATPGQSPTPVPDIGAHAGLPSSGDLTAPGLLALSARPALPSAVLELPETNLRARFSTGPYSGRGSPGGVPGGTPGAAGGQAEGPGGEGGGPGTLPIPDIFVAPAGPVPPGPVVAGLGSGLPGQPPAAAPSRSPAPDREGGAKAEVQRTKSPQERAEQILEGIRPGARASGAATRPRVYTIYVNMPNLSSQAGSWVLHLAEFDEHNTAVPGGAANGFPLEAPVVVKKVDPKYPAAARRDRVEGSVFLYGIIRPDGTVDRVRVVRGLHQLLDQNAVVAFQSWRFEPGRKNSAAVSVEVVVEIPFRLTKLF